MQPARPPLPESLYTAEQVRRLDAAAIESGIPGRDLMERAGAAAWARLRSAWPRCRRLAVVCGAGNNAGDGYIVARLAAEAGLDVAVTALKDPDQLSGDALAAARAYRDAGHGVQAWPGDGLGEADVIVDALLGTGLDREVAGDFRAAVEAVNAAGAPVLAVDIPSGLHADTGAVMGAAVRASRTVSFIGLKQGLLTGMGPEYCGELVFDDLEVPAGIYESVPANARRVTWAGQKSQLGRRARGAHKGDFGHVLVVGGDYGFAGAVRMAAEAAARTGAGLVSIATRPEHAFHIPLARPELMARGIDTMTDLNPLLDRATVVAIGPGLGQSDWSQALLARVLDGDRPLVVDADALNLLAREPVTRDDWILTPHPGEAARLLESRAAEVQADRFAAAAGLQRRYGGVCVLKGSGTLVAPPSGPIRVCGDGNPGMASGGMGDVLTGVLAGLLAQGQAPAAAATLGVCLHAAAADAAAREGERGLLATDLFAELRRLANP